MSTAAPAGNGTGTRLDWSFCTDSSKCGVGQGDCDHNSQCQGSLVCGRDNCRDWNPAAEQLADCCMVDPLLNTTASNGTGSCQDWDFCIHNSCQEGQGDCDTDAQCGPGLVCGNDNCRQWHPSAERGADCCTLPSGSGGSGNG